MIANLINSLSVNEETAYKFVEKGLKSLDDIAYADDSVLGSIVENEVEVLRITAAAEDAAVLEAVGALSEEEDNLESLNSLDLSEENIQKLTAQVLITKMI